MTHLRQRMLEDLQLRDYSVRTQQVYVRAVRLLAEHYGLRMAQVMAIGDLLNDLPMVEMAGLGVAVLGLDNHSEVLHLHLRVLLAVRVLVLGNGIALLGHSHIL